MLEQLDTHMQKQNKKKLHSYLPSYKKINSKCIIDLNVHSKTAKLTEKKKRISS